MYAPGYRSVATSSSRYTRPSKLHTSFFLQVTKGVTLNVDEACVRTCMHACMHACMHVCVCGGGQAGRACEAWRR